MTVLSKPQSDPTGKGDWRWPHDLRMHMAVAVCAQLTLAEKAAVRDGAPLPTHSAKMNAVYAQLRSDVREYLQNTRRTPDSELPSADSIRKAAQRWALRLLREGHVDDYPPHLKGYKMTPVRLEILGKLEQLLVAGFKGPVGTFPYRSLKHAMLMSSEIRDLVLQLGVAHPETVWRMLLHAFPDVYKGKWYTCKMRENERTQVCRADAPSSTN